MSTGRTVLASASGHALPDFSANTTIAAKSAIEPEARSATTGTLRRRQAVTAHLRHRSGAAESASNSASGGASGNR